MLRNVLIAALLAASTPVLAMDMPLLTFPEAPPVTTSTANGK